MSLSASAFLNQRFQFSYDVSAYGSLYASLSVATWRLQVRPSPGSPKILLDFATGGSSQSAANVIVYYPTAGLITVFCPTSSLVGIPPGTYIFDFGFTLPYADFERVDGGLITFAYGSTAAGVQGSPAAPPGSDDTVTLGSGSTTNSVPASILGALAAANLSATSAQTNAVAAANAVRNITALVAQAQTYADIALQAQLAAQVSEEAAVAAAGSRITMTTVLVTATNTLANLVHVWDGKFAFMIAKGIPYLTTGAGSAFSIAGSTVTWTPANAGGVNLNPGDPVMLAYSY